jgi:hypothetical protein
MWLFHDLRTAGVPGIILPNERRLLRSSQSWSLERLPKSKRND